MSLLFSTAQGEPRNEHLSAEYLAALETRQRTPYYLNLHYQDVGHTLISGVTGSGKSFTCSFLLEHAQKYGPQTVIFDLGGSYRELTQRLWRVVHDASASSGTSSRSIRSASTPRRENLHFLFSFVKVLIEAGEYRMTDRDDKELHATIENIYQLDRDVRRLGTVAACLPLAMRQHLARWVEGGQYAALFDNAEDTLTCARFHTFDFEGMQKYPQILEPLLFYILHRANAHIYGTAAAHTLKLFLLDEAWLFFRNPTVKAYIVEGAQDMAQAQCRHDPRHAVERRSDAERHAADRRRKLRQSDLSRESADGSRALQTHLPAERYGSRADRESAAQTGTADQAAGSREGRSSGSSHSRRGCLPLRNTIGAICRTESRSSSSLSSPVVP